VPSTKTRPVAEPARRRASRLAAGARSARGATLRVLLPVDGSEGSHRAVDHLVRSFERLRPVALHLLNVQSPIPIPLLKRWRFNRSEALEQQQQEGLKALEVARARLDKAKIAYEHQVAVGPVAETIVRYARRWRCDVIIIGTRGLGRTPSLVLGSVAVKVIRMAKVPVTLVN